MWDVITTAAIALYFNCGFCIGIVSANIMIKSHNQSYLTSFPIKRQSKINVNYIPQLQSLGSTIINSQKATTTKLKTLKLDHSVVLV